MLSAGGAWWASGALVALGCVEHELAEEFAGHGVDDPDVEVVGEDDDVGSGVGSSDADGVHLAVVAPGDLAALSTLSWRTRSWVSLSRWPGLGVALGRLA